MAETVIAAESVGRRLGGRWALRDISLQVHRGESVMLHGANGSGKTTLLRVLGSALSPTVGTVRTFGGIPRDHRGTIGLLSHADGHYDDLSGRDNLSLARSLGSLPGDVAALLDRVGLMARANDPVRVYSAGMRKRLAFARLLLKNPALVLLDEPYAALDHEGHEFVDLLLASLRAEGRTVVVSTHQVRRVRGFCDRAIQLEAGRIVEFGTGGIANPEGAKRDVDTRAARDSGAPSATSSRGHSAPPAGGPADPPTGGNT